MKNLLKTIVAFALLTVSALAADLVNVSGASKAAVNGYDNVAKASKNWPGLVKKSGK